MKTTFKSYVQEGRLSLSDDDTLKWTNAHCQDFLKQSGNLPLYRGIKYVGKEKKREVDTIVTPRTDRVPRDTKKHALWNAVFNIGVELATGIPRIREQAVFTTGSYDNAELYGYPHYVFPQDGFNFLYFTKGQPHDTTAIQLEDDVLRSFADVFEQEPSNDPRFFDLAARVYKAADRKIDILSDVYSELAFLKKLDYIDSPQTVDEMRSYFADAPSENIPARSIRWGTAKGSKEVVPPKVVDVVLDWFKSLVVDMYGLKVNENLSQAIQAEHEIILYNVAKYSAFDVEWILDANDIVINRENARRFYNRQLLPAIRGSGENDTQ